MIVISIRSKDRQDSESDDEPSSQIDEEIDLEMDSITDTTRVNDDITAITAHPATLLTLRSPRRLPLADQNGRLPDKIQGYRIVLKK